MSFYSLLGSYFETSRGLKRYQVVNEALLLLPLGSFERGFKRVNLCMRLLLPLGSYTMPTGYVLLLSQREFHLIKKLGPDGVRRVLLLLPHREFRETV